MYTPHTFRTGAGAYAQVGVEIAAMSASPHQLISMLFDGARSTIGMARFHMSSGALGPKGTAISKAIDIVDNGLKAALDAKAGGAEGEALVSNLSALYGYIIQRLLQANLRNDVEALNEADALLEDIASAWSEIGAGPSDR